MARSNYIYFILGIVLFILGMIIESNRGFFNDPESIGYLGHFLWIFGILTFLLQFGVWIIKILIRMIN